MTESDEKLQQAFSLHQSGQIEMAIIQYQALLDTQTDSAKVNELLGIAHAQKQSYQDALQYFKKAASLKPDHLSIKTNLATCYKKMGNTKKAVSIYKDILKHNPAQCITLNNLGSLYIQINQFDLASIKLLKAICLQPDYADAYYNLALMNNDSSYFKKASELGHAQASYQYALSQEASNHLKEAKAFYEKALSGIENHALSHHGLGRVLLALGEDEDALFHFIQAQKIDPYIPNLMENIGSYYHVKGMHANAVEYWLKALSQTQDIEIMYNIGVAYHYMNRHQDALSYFKMVLDKNPNHLKSHTNIAAIALQNNQTTVAISHYETVLALDPDNEEVQYVLSALKQKRHSFEQSPASYVTNLFDQYASHYNQHLLKMLKYQLPQKVKLILEETLITNHYKICDLGCGTGLLGPILKPFAKHLVGVDLSSNMLLKAKETQCYDELVNMDCLSYLNQSSFDLILALELFPYIGDIQPLLKKIAQSLLAEGLFIFSIETTSEDEYTLSPYARYQHNPKWVIQTLKDLSLEIVESEPTVLRTQNAKPVSGYLFVCKKPALR